MDHNLSGKHIKTYIRLQETFDEERLKHAAEVLAKTAQYGAYSEVSGTVITCVSAVRFVLNAACSTQEESSVLPSHIFVGSLPGVLLHQEKAMVVHTATPQSGDLLFCGRKHRDITHVMLCIKSSIFQATNKEGGMVGAIPFSSLDGFMKHHGYYFSSMHSLRTYIDERDRHKSFFKPYV